MYFSIISSGSKGNAILVGCSRIKFLVDAGLSGRKLTEFLDNKNLSIDDLSFAIITHEHSDHVNAVKFLLKNGVPVIGNSGLKNYLIKKNIPGAVDFFKSDNVLKFDNIRIEIFPVYHDASNPIGIFIQNKNKALTIIIDTGYLDQRAIEYINKSDALIIDSNYDEEIMRESDYPQFLKYRIKSKTGHLSNNDIVKFIKYNLTGKKLKKIALAHLSEKNNDPAVAYNKILTAIKNEKLDIDLYVSSQNNYTERIKV